MNAPFNFEQGLNFDTAFIFSTFKSINNNY